MAVIINEFEVVVEAPSPAAGQTQAPPAPQPPAIRTEDIIRVQQRQRQRMKRVAAY